MKDDTVEAELENNVGRLLKSAATPPRMDPVARERVLGALLEAQARRAATTASKTAPTTEGKTAVATRPGAERAASVTRLRRVGAVSLGALALAAGIAIYATRSDAPKDPVATAVTFENEGPGPREVVLRDGSRATIDVGAKLVERAPSDVELVAGQAVFDVGPTAGSLGVTTSSGAVFAAKTRFWIRAGAEGAEVAVARGKASLTSKSGAKATVGAGQEVVMRAAAVSSVAAPRVSHLFGFARRTNADAALANTVAPSKKGTLVGRDPTWGREAPVDLRAFAVDVVVEDGFARTTIDQTYFNPRLRQIEGLYSFPIPHGSALSRVAMYVDGKRMEGAVVDRSRGRDIYEGIVHQRRDPALLEWMGADTFDLRIFPLPARTEKRVLLSYTTALEHLYDEERLVVPIPEVDQAAGKASFRVRIVGGADREVVSPSHVVQQVDDGNDRVVTFDATSYTLGQDLVLTMRGGETGKGGVRTFEEEGRRFFRVEVDPELARGAPTSDAPRPKSVAVLFDVSASRGEGDLAAGARFVDGVLDALDVDDTVSIVAVGHVAHTFANGSVRAADLDRAAVAAFLRAEGRGVGDSRLDLGFQAANAALAGTTGDREILYVGDGAAVAVGKDVSLTKPEALVAALSPGTRFIGVGIGDGVDRGMLEALSSATGGFSITVGESEDLGARAFDVVATTYTRCLAKVEADVVDARGDAVPGAIAELGAPSVCDGERADVIARFAGAADRPGVFVRVRGVVDGKAWEKKVDLAGAAGGAAYLPRVFAERHVRTLLASAGALADTPTEELGVKDKEVVEEITALARKNFLVTPFTSLLVLENDAMYAQFKLERKAPTGWAVYAAPDTIPVVTEPVGASGIVVDDSWDVLERSPVNLLGDPAMHMHAQWWGADFRSAVGRAPRVRMGGMDSLAEDARKGTGDRIRSTNRLGQGVGRLSGAHRVSPGPKTKASKQSMRMLEKQGRVWGADVPRGADVETSIAPALLPDLAPSAGAADDWMADAFAGAPLATGMWTGDPRLRDLTAYAPAMFTDAFDQLSDVLAADAVAAAPKQQPEARALLDRVLLAAPPKEMTLTGADGTTIVTRSPLQAGGFWRTRALPTGLEEIADFNGRDLRVTYPELGLSTVRAPGSATILWLLREAPMVLPPRAVFDALDLELVDANTIRARLPVPPGTSKEIAATVPSIEISFGADLQIASVAWVSGATRRELKIERTGDTVVVRFADDPGASATFTAKAGGTPSSTASNLAVVELPLRNPGSAPAMDSKRTPEQVVHAERQLVAAYVALQDDAKVLEHLALIDAAAGGLSRGDAALGSRALSRGSDEAKKLVGHAPKGDPVRSFVERGPDAKPPKGAGPLLSFVADYAGMLKLLETTPTDAFPKALAAFRKKHPEARFEQYALARTASDRVAWQNARVALDAWDALAGDAALAPIVDRAWAHVAQDGGEGDEKARGARLVGAIDSAVDRGWAIGFDWRDVNILRQARGDAGVRVQMTKWRDAILTAKRAEQIESLIDVMRNPYLDQRAQLDLDAGRVVRVLDESVGIDDGIRARAVGTLLEQGLRAEADVLLASMMKRPGGPSVSALELRAFLAADGGNLDEAARLYDRLLVVTADTDMDLEDARAWYATLVDLHMRRAGLATGAAVDVALAQAFAVADRWRKEDPSNPAIDELCATALYKIGRTDDADAFVASIVDRRPADGAAWGQAGELFERQGRFDQALAAFERAALVEPTNPTWLWREASLRKARGATGDAAGVEALTKKIRDGKWQPRFTNVVWQASQL